MSKSVILAFSAIMLLLIALPAQTQTDPIPTPTRTPIPITPLWVYTPGFTPSATYTLTPSPTFTPSMTPTPAPYSDHYRLARPIAEGGVDVIDRVYPYGGTQRGTFAVHSGVEFVNPRGTPVIAAADGSVIFAGTDDQVLIGPRLNYYGNVVIVMHPNLYAPEGVPIYTLYGHLDRIDVTIGTTVRQGDRLGTVGASGIAIGSHLHFEVRVGDPYDFYATRNPDLYLFPKPNTAMVVGRVRDLDGNYLYEVPIQFRRADTTGGLTWETFTYGDAETVNSSMTWGENFTRGDLRPGDYEVFVSTLYGQKLYSQVITLEPNRTTWIDIQIPAGHVFIPGGRRDNLTPEATPEITPQDTEEPQNFG